MIKRTVTGIVMAGVLLLMVYLTSFSHFVFDGLVLIVGAIAAYEIYTALKKSEVVVDDGEKRGYNVSLVSMILCVAGVYPLCYFFGYMGLFFNYVIAVLCAFVIFIFDQKKQINDFAINCFALFYPIHPSRGLTDLI